jgi:hypothetical protein
MLRFPVWLRRLDDRKPRNYKTRLGYAKLRRSMPRPYEFVQNAR